jgi:hypothetical protein
MYNYELVLKDKILYNARMDEFNIEKQLPTQIKNIIYEKGYLDYVFSKEEFEMFETIKKDGRKLHLYTKKDLDETKISHNSLIYTMDCATTYYPSSMMYIDVNKHYNQSTPEKKHFFIDEIIEPYFQRNGVNGLVFMNYVDKGLVLLAIKNSTDKQLELFKNFYQHLDRNISTFEKHIDLSKSDLKEILKRIEKKIMPEEKEVKNTTKERTV